MQEPQDSEHQALIVEPHLEGKKQNARSNSKRESIKSDIVQF